MVVRVESIIRRLQALRDYIHRLRPYQSRSLQELTEDEIVYAAVLRWLQLAAQCVMDITSHLHTELDLEPVDEYDEVILGLGRHGVLPREFAQRICKLPRLRNILVHEYLAIDPAKVHDVLLYGLDDLEEFIEHIQSFLQREGYLPSKGDIDA